MEPTIEVGKRGGSRQARILLAVCLAIDALVIWLLLGTDFIVGDSFVYAKDVEQAIAERQPSRSPRMLRVSGVLVSGSLVTPASCQTRFRLRPEHLAPGSAGAPQPELGVIYRSCELPDTFCDLPQYELTVNVTGHLTGTALSPLLEAASVRTTCPSIYVVDRSACDTAPESARQQCPMCLQAGSSPQRW